jgi:malate dehydrogenase (oxaloacetate-decarboxylating)
MLVSAPLAIFNHMKPGDLIPKPLYPTVHQALARAVKLAAKS